MGDADVLQSDSSLGSNSKLSNAPEDTLPPLKVQKHNPKLFLKRNWRSSPYNLSHHKSMKEQQNSHKQTMNVMGKTQEGFFHPQPRMQNSMTPRLASSSQTPSFV